MNGLADLHRTITACRRCPRLVRWRESAAQNPPRRYVGQSYWAKPLPGFGDPGGRVLVIGLAPAAHGGNRTGRMFTGDRSGDWLYSALHGAGFANQPTAIACNDGLRLIDCYITAAVHCAPPGNKPTHSEFKRCQTYLIEELKLFQHAKVIIALGKIAFDAFWAAYQKTGGKVSKPRPKFAHGLIVKLPDGPHLVCSYHPSQQNTFTGKLTRSMLDTVFIRAKAALGA